MAEFLDKLKVRIDKGLTTVNTKSKEIIERQKIRLHLSEIEAERKIVFQELGKLVYRQYQLSGWEPEFTIGQASVTAGSSGLDRWEESVLDVLGRISGGELPGILFEDTAKQFKVTAKTLCEEVEKHLPDSEKKGQNLQWLGRVLGKFKLAAKKVSKRIDGERETVYVFDKQKTRSVLEGLKSAGASGVKPEKTGKDAGGAPEKDPVLAACAKLADIDSKIEKLKKEMKKIGEKI
ncbi:MAG TPA: hypothetical protein VLG45_09270 [Thermodesulfobacteriota bacterium]|nr:hypothetical protein [Thermodesulfobacteriota bacterium]